MIDFPPCPHNYTHATNFQPTTLTNQPFGTVLTKPTTATRGRRIFFHQSSQQQQQKEQAQGYYYFLTKSSIQHQKDSHSRANNRRGRRTATQTTETAIQRPNKAKVELDIIQADK
jgi:hypothetical protein